MSIAAHREALRASLTAYFQTLSAGVTDAALFNMALGRTGNYPVDIFNCPEFDDDGLVENSLAAHIHHILSFPATCPALSTVTNLAFQAPATAQDAEHFSQLFHLCPALESLALLHVSLEIAPFVPAGPAPASLRHVMLGSGDPDLDLTMYCATWRLDGLRDIIIYQSTDVGEHLVHLISGALMLDVRREVDGSTTSLTALGPGLRRREIEYWEEEDDQNVLAGLMIAAQSTLAGVCAMSVPATSLEPFLAVFAALPALQHLKVYIQEDDGDADAHVFQWNQLDPLARLPEHCPGLHSLILNVICTMPQCPPAAQDARDLLAQLQGMAHVALPSIFVSGFSAVAPCDVQLPRFEGFSVMFSDAAGTCYHGTKEDHVAQGHATSPNIREPSEPAYLSPCKLQPAEQMANASLKIIFELAESCGAHFNRLRGIPNEILAICFAFLPLRDRILVSHVSRHWRAVSLAHPAIWAKLDFFERFKNVPAVLDLALSRSGRHPVHIYDCPGPDIRGVVARALAAHMSHIQTIWCSYGRSSVPLTLPAPMLRTLRGNLDHELVIISPSFLGGHPGQLRTLALCAVLLPPVCPALSTITDLSLTGPSDVDQAAGFSRLFLLCPVLESLKLEQLQHSLAHYLPRTPSPQSLRKISLETIDADYDLMQHYLDWRSPNLVNVEIDQEISSPQNLQPLVNGAVELTVGREYAFDRTFISACGPDWIRSINFSNDGDPAAHSAAMVLAVQSNLIDVVCMELPATSLAAFVPVLAGLPQLRELTLYARADFDIPGGPAHDIGWEALELLPQLPARIELVIVDVVCGHPDCPLSARDVQDLCSALRRVSHARLPHILVKGFTAETLSTVEIPDFDGFGIDFDVAVEA
ncbi:hypothetical protein AURDEDRAFT_128110 [Auricularia subglabra TFB-10046 SS5]|uniref:F-box domain-containing protein n=1 Tax=Auricularia subglabra (strain TFB-10046 / SS5) TaxID=717982 RepID=J0LJ91_AURST|nr:hypothetical protein AURDEDRAFT_128110 [Auricularia subglabra TFB-10046 SS5]